MEHVLSERIKQLETLLLEPETRRNKTALDRLLSDSFREFGKSGSIYDKTDVILALSSELSIHTFQIDDFRIESLSPDCVLATYRLKVVRAGETTKSLRSSLWRITTDDWELHFHQGTAILDSENVLRLD